MGGRIALTAKLSESTPFSKPRLQRIASTTTVKKVVYFAISNRTASKSTEKTGHFIYFSLWDMNWVDE